MKLLLAFLFLQNIASAASLTLCAELAQSYRAFGFTGAILVKENGKILCSEVMGSRTVNGSPIQVTDHFLIGSVTKQFTAAAIMLLQERKLLSVSDTLATYFPDWPLAQGITLKHLLTHTSGIADFTSTPEFKAWAKTPFHELSPLVKLIQTLKSDFAPGAKWDYSNSNFTLLSAIVEKVSGMEWGAFVDSQLIQPMGLRQTRFDTVKTRELVSGHEFNRDYELQPIEDSIYFERGWASGAGGIESTIEDLALWNEGLFGGAIIKPESIAEMAKPQAKIDDTYGYGYGLFQITNIPNEEVIFHSGGIPGFTAMNIYLPKKKRSIIVLSNSFDGKTMSELAWKLFSLSQGGVVESPSLREVSLPANQLQEKAANYRFAELGVLVSLRMDGGALYAKINEGKEYRMIPQSNLVFYYRAENLYFEFSPDLQVISFKEGKTTYKGKREGSRLFNLDSSHGFKRSLLQYW